MDSRDLGRVDGLPPASPPQDRESRPQSAGLQRFALARVDAAIAEADALLDLQAEVCGPAASPEALRAALVHVDAQIRGLSMLSLCGPLLHQAPVSPAAILARCLELRRRIEIRLARREGDETET